VLQPVRSFITGKTPATLTAIYQNRAPKVVIAQGGLKNGSRRRSIVLDASVSSDPEGGPVSFAWRFSDGKRYRNPVIRRSFPRDGRYTVWLTVRDSLGGQSSILRTISVSSRKGARLR
jgi:PKD repeat protein